MTNRQKRALETRRKIVEAAQVVIREKGFDKVSVGDIAKAAGVATGSFYTYFKRKEDVVEAINETDFYRLAEIVNGMGDVDLIERLAYYCHEFLAAIEQSGIEVCRQWIRNNLAPTKMHIHDEDITKYDFDERAMTEVLNEGVRRKELKEDTPLEELALYINAELYGLMVIWCMSDADVIGSDKTDAFCRELAARAIKPYKSES